MTNLSCYIFLSDFIAIDFLTFNCIKSHKIHTDNQLFFIRLSMYFELFSVAKKKKEEKVFR